MDGLRGIAILAVLVEHFVPAGHPILAYPWGAFGVRLFFVLSGFLITAILLDARTLVVRGEGRGGVLTRFYARRALRIFPIYYASIAAMTLVFAVPSFAWYALYVSNWLPMFGRPNPFNWYWTLAVEEQFYLVWPWLVLSLPARRVAAVAAAAVVVAPAAYVAITVSGFIGEAAYKNTFTNFDSLAAGALLALAARQSLPAARRVTVACGAVGVAFAAVFLRPIDWHTAPLYHLTLLGPYLTFLNAGVVGAVLFYRDARPVAAAGWVLEAAPLRYVGRISYGLYVYHGLVLWLVPPVAQRLGLPWPSEWPGRAAIYSAVVLSGASASWHLFEKPINNLKRHFPYSTEARPGGPGNRLAVAADPPVTHP